MSTKIATLSESLFAHVALIRPLPGVFSEMITKVATFFEHAITSLELTFEVHFHSQSLLILYLYCFMPIVWNAWERFLDAVVALVDTFIIRVLNVFLLFDLDLRLVDFFVSSSLIRFFFGFYLSLLFNLRFSIRL